MFRYLLSSSHPVGRFKARFFEALGYTADQAERLEQDIRNLLLSSDPRLREKTEFGQKYEVRGVITGPQNRSVELVTVWIVLPSEEVPRFITAYPGDE
ncbi:MAG: hypothetical protein O7D29_07835 [Gemmatimonadetes bacterium]|nr:hypothetical protein [Gemmatimonadota bacterium]